MAIRIALIGAGGRGRMFKQIHAPQAGVELAAICDLSPTVREEYQAEFPGIAIYDDYQKLLDGGPYDGIGVMTPDFLHDEHGVAALRTGAAVYLEKPMAITPQGCQRLLAAAAEHGNRLYVGHNMRFFPVIRKMKEIIDSGRIGQVQAIWCRHFIDYGGDAYFKDWHSERRYSTGLLLQKGAHDIDLIHYFAGGRTSRVVGMGKLSVYDQVQDRRSGPSVPVVFKPENWPPAAQKGLSPVIDVEDHSMMMMQLDNGVQASYVQCHYTPDGWRNYTIIGTAGRIENAADHSDDQHKAVVRVFDQRRPGCSDGDEQIIIPPAEGGHGGADPKIITDFVNLIRTGKSQGATPADACNAVLAGYFATQSLRNGNQPYDVPAASDLCDECHVEQADVGVT